MIRGYYSAASGIITQEKRLNSISHNIANVSTSGYKRDGLVMGTFGEHIATRMNAYQGKPPVEIGPGVFMQTIVDEYTDFMQGGFEQTNRPMDMAVAGVGFFVVQGPDGNPYLTRDGQFSLDAEGFLSLPGYGRVQGDGGDIQIGTSEFAVTPEGGILRYTPDEEEPEFITRLLIVQPEDYDAMEKAANGLYVSEDFGIAEMGTYSVRQGYAERSNVNIAYEMAEMIASQRSFHSCSQVLKMYDELADQMNTRISRAQG